MKPGGTRDRHDRLTYLIEKNRVPDPVDPITDDGVFWPDGFKFAAWASHDVDRFYTPRVRIHQSVTHLRKKRLRKCAKTLLGSDPSTIGKIVELDESLGIRSTFFLLADNYGHDLNGVGIGLDKGFEFGLHASYDSHLSRKKLKQEKMSLEKAINVEGILGVRHHYLRFRKPETWKSQMGIFKYDSTLAWPDYVGYRDGKANPFPTQYGLWEIPLAVMDVTVFNVQKIRWRELKNLVDSVYESGGVFTYLWHNESLAEISATRPWRETYVKLTHYLQEKGAWFATGREIIEWAEDNWPFQPYEVNSSSDFQ